MASYQYVYVMKQMSIRDGTNYFTESRTSDSEIGRTSNMTQTSTMGDYSITESGTQLLIRYQCFWDFVQSLGLAP